MVAKRVHVFIEHLQRFLLNPDIPMPCETEPVYEAGAWGLHMFFDHSFQTQVMNVWNATSPYYMGDWLIDDRHCLSETHPRLPSEGRGDKDRDDRYLHLSLHQIGLDYGIDYGSTMFFAGVATMVGAGAYRADYTREEIIRQVLRSDLEAPSLSEAQLGQYLALREQLAWIHMNPGSSQQSPDILPVRENGFCGLHVFHPDPAVLKLMDMLDQPHRPRRNAPGPCPAVITEPFLHLNIGRIHNYLENTPFFARAS